jgi:protoheme IX farnesyltransferase
MISNIAAAVAIAGGAVMSWYSFKLVKSCDIADARKVMFTSFFYLPIVQLAYVLDKIQ